MMLLLMTLLVGLLSPGCHSFLCFKRKHMMSPLIANRPMATIRWKSYRRRSVSLFGDISGDGADKDEVTSSHGFNVNDPFDSSIDKETFEAFLETMRNTGKQNRLQRRALLKQMSLTGNGVFGVLDAHTFTKKVEDDPLMPQINTIALSGSRRKAEGITAIRVSKATVMTEFFMILVGKSRPQNEAIALSISEEMIKQHNRTCSRQGNANSGWILLDYGDIIVNVMTPKSREYYDIDGFWGARGEYADLSEVLSEQKSLPSFENQFGNEGNEFRLASNLPFSASNLIGGVGAEQDEEEDNDEGNEEEEEEEEDDYVDDAHVIEPIKHSKQFYSPSADDEEDQEEEEEKYDDEGDNTEVDLMGYDDDEEEEESDESDPFWT
jgi:ribosome-associated protein